MKVPTLFGVPLYQGMKRRVAKKYIRHYWRFVFISEKGYRRWMKDMADKGVGSLVQGCSSFNERIKEVQAEYCRVGKGKFLADVQVYSENNGCNAKYCGVDNPYTYEEVLKHVEETRNHPEAKMWGWDIRFSPEVFTLYEDGTYSINREREKELEAERKTKQ